MQFSENEICTEEEYLQFERSSQQKHEYTDGRIYAMTGASARHGTIALNIATALNIMLKGYPCRPFIETLKVRIKEARSFYYPDVLVTCTGLENEDIDFNESPVIVVEVLSKSTAARDRGEKQRNYSKLESLKEYVLVHQKRKRVEVHRRNEANSWEQIVFQGEEDVILHALSPLELRLPMKDIYDNVKADGTLKVKEDTPEYLLSENELLELSW